MTDFVHTRAFIEQLPDGLASHPACSIKASLYRSYLERHPVTAEQLQGLPDVIVDMVRNPFPVSAWIPAAHSLAYTMVTRDLFAPQDDAFRQLVHETTSAMYQSRMYRILMSAVSPERLLKSAQVRWGKFNRGTTMTSIMEGPNHAKVSFTFPERLYGPAHAPGLMGAYAAALELTGTGPVRGHAELSDQTTVTAEFFWGAL